MDNSTATLIEKLATAVGKTGADVVQYYTTWFIADSIIWGLFGCLLMFLSFKIKSLPWGEEIEEELPFLIPIVQWAVFLLGCTVLATNLVDLFAPQGIAVHQLIKDLRG